MIPQKVKRFIAGEHISDAIDRVKFLNKNNIRGMIDYVGEELKTKGEVEKALYEYEKLIDEIIEHGISADIDIKLTNLGLLIDKKYCLKNVKKLLKYAKGKHIWIDAESYRYWEDSLDIFLKAHKEFHHIQITVQAYLKKSEEYVKKIIKAKGVVRLVKGVYKESSKVAFTKKSDIKKQYLKLVNMLYNGKKSFAVATHDEKLIKEVLKLRKGRKIPELQFLLGLGDKLAKKYKKCLVAEYVPYGHNWKGYYERRKEYLKKSI